jgi:hypothetical protein
MRACLLRALESNEKAMTEQLNKRKSSNKADL